MLLEDGYIAINPVFDKLVTSLRTAIEDNGILDKEITSYNDAFDAFRLALRYYKINQGEKREESALVQYPSLFLLLNILCCNANRHMNCHFVCSLIINAIN